MALWRPYLQETPSDLSTGSQISLSPTHPAPIVKMEKISPLLRSYALEVQRTPIYYGSYDPIPFPQHHEYQPAVSPLESSCESWSQMKLNAPCPDVLSPPESYENDSLSDDQEYLEFERESFKAMAEKNGGSIVHNNPRMRRVVQTAKKTDDYKKQREKNNIAAKQSRDRRKLREARLGFQVSFLKKKVAELKARLDKGVCARCAIS